MGVLMPSMAVVVCGEMGGGGVLYVSVCVLGGLNDIPGG